MNFRGFVEFIWFCIVFLNFSTSRDAKLNFTKLHEVISLDDDNGANYRSLLYIFFSHFLTLNHRGLLKRVRPPMVPYLGLHFKDMVFTNDGNPDHIHDRVNLQKFLTLGGSILLLTKGTTKPYEFTVNEEIQKWFLNCKAMSNEELFWWSKRVEPKDVEEALSSAIETELKLKTVEAELANALLKIKDLETALQDTEKELAELKTDNNQRERKHSAGQEREKLKLAMSQQLAFLDKKRKEVKIPTNEKISTPRSAMGLKTLIHLDLKSITDQREDGDGIERRREGNPDTLSERRGASSRRERVGTVCEEERDES
jgi:hypothetical protein